MITSLLIIISILNILLAAIIFIRQKNNLASMYFGLILVFAGFWSYSLIYYYQPEFIFFKLFAIKLIYIFGLMVSLFYLGFALTFSYKVRFFKLLMTIGSLLCLPLLFYIIVNDSFIIAKELLPVEKTMILNNLIYLVVFLLFFITGYISLLNKFNLSDGLLKKQLMSILVGTFLSIILVVITNIVLPIFNVVAFTWMGPLFTLINFSIISMLLFKK